MDTRNARRGFTLLEMVIAMTILVLVMGLPFAVLDSTHKSYGTRTTLAELESKARQALDDVVEALNATSVGRITSPMNAVPGWADNVVFSRPTGVVAGVPDWGAAECIRFEYSLGDPNDGIDNDGNGLVDEGRVVWYEDFEGPGERRRTLCNWAAEFAAGETAGNGTDDDGNGLVDDPGLSFTYDGERVTVRLTLQRLDPEGRPVSHTALRTVAFRNNGS